MIDKNSNIITDTEIKRVVQHNLEDRQITFLDQRFYSRNSKFYPSVTFILSYIPKNKIFIDWIKEKGEESDIVVKQASEKGKQVHSTIERLLKGEEINWINKNGDANYSLEVWQMLLRFKEFWLIHQPKLVHVEEHVFSDEHEFAGTIDLVLEMFGEIWIIDIKTSNQIPPVYHFQTAAYNMAWNECFDKPATRRGILWLKAHTRKPDKNGKKVQGRGWQLIESERSLEDDFKSFKLFQDVFRHECDTDRPYSEIYPTSIKL
jgi:hypothetical protein